MVLKEESKSGAAKGLIAEAVFPLKGISLESSEEIFHTNVNLRVGLRRLLVTCGAFARYFFVAFSWLFRGPLLSRKTVFGPFSWLFCGFP